MPSLFPDLTEWVVVSGGDLSKVEIRDASIPQAEHQNNGGNTAYSSSMSMPTNVVGNKGIWRGRGLFATENIGAGETIFSIPLSLLVTENVARSSQVGQAVMDYSASAGFVCPPRTILTLFVMMERDEADEVKEPKTAPSPSSYKYYINSLPRKYGTPPFVAESDGGKQLGALQGTPVGDREASRRQEMRQTYSAFFPALTQRYPDLFPESKCSFERYLWAHSSVSTRLFPSDIALPGKCTRTADPPEQSVSAHAAHDCGMLVPVADMMNHDFARHVEWRASRNTDEGPALLKCVCVHGSELKKGDEILFSYGPHSNGRLFITYGFCLPQNPYNVVRVSFGLKRSAKTQNIDQASTTVDTEALYEKDATSNLVAAGVLTQNSDQSVWSFVVPSVTRSESELETTTAMRAALAIAKASDVLCDDDTRVNHHLLAIMVLHRAVTQAIAVEQAGLQRSKASTLQSLEDATNVRLYREGGIDSLVWMLELIEVAVRKMVMDTSKNQNSHSKDTFQEELVRNETTARLILERLCGPLATDDTGKIETTNSSRIRDLMEESFQLCVDFEAVNETLVHLEGTTSEPPEKRQKLK